MANPRSRYEAVSRRAFLTRSLAIGAVVLVPGLACGGTNDREALADPAPSSSAATPSTATPTTATPTTSAATTATTTSAAPSTAPAATAAPTTAAPATTAAPPTTAALVAGTGVSPMTIQFTFAAGGGRVRNPYVAVWLEDASGAMVRTVALWFENGKGTRWLPDLRRWYQSAGSAMDQTIATVSSATRAPGSYAVVWDGSADSGAPVAPGSYFICIEAAREHGPYELIREAVTLGPAPLSMTLPDNGELTGASLGPA